MTTMPPTVSPGPSRSPTPRRMSGPIATRAEIAHEDRRAAARRVPTTIVAEVLDRPRVAAAARPCTRRPRARRAARPTSSLPARIAATTRVDRDAVGGELRRVELRPGTASGSRRRPRPRRRRARSAARSAGASPGSCAAPRGRACRSRSTSAYWYTQPTPVASGPSSVRTPSGRRGRIFERYSSVAAARPVQVRAVLEDDVDVREAEVGEAADRLDARRAEQRRDDRVGDLVLDDVRAAVPARVDDHLRVRTGRGSRRGDARRRAPTPGWRPPPPRVRRTASRFRAQSSMIRVITPSPQCPA